MSILTNGKINQLIIPMPEREITNSELATFARAIEAAVIKRLAGVSVEPVNNDLADDIVAIDAMHRGDPSYEHDAYYMRKQAETCVRKGYRLFTVEAVAAARVQALEEARDIVLNFQAGWIPDGFTECADAIRALLGKEAQS